MNTNFSLEQSNYWTAKLKSDYRIFTVFFLLCFSNFGHAQKGNGNGNGNKPKDLVVRSCTTYIGNGLYSASFSYENPTNQEINVAEDDSFVRYNNGNNKTKSLNKFKKGNVSKAFTKEFRTGGSVEWTVIQSNGKTHTIVANANSSHCTGEEEGFIFPVYKQGTGKSEEIIGQELMALAELTSGDIPDPLIYQINNDKVLIEIIPIEGHMTDVIALLQTTFGLKFVPNPLIADFIIDEVTLPTLEVIDVYFPIASLLLLNTYTNDINFARTLYPPIKNSTGDGFTGNAVSQGDATQKSDIVRASFKLINGDSILPVDGTGITIGVMSNSFDTQPFSSGNPSQATLDVIAGDLPGAANTHGYTSDVVVLKEYPYGVASDEGRAMLHIIHDVAPGASLAFHTGTLSPRNFEVGFDTLAVNSDFIVDDITFITEPFFGESRISAAIEAFTDDTHRHFTSAGNFANSGYQGIFNATTSLPINNNFLEETARAHIFDGSTGDYIQEIAVEGGKTYMIVLQWDETSASQNNSLGADVDLDFYIVDDSGRILVGNNRSNENGDAAEIMVFTATANGTANIMITSANGATTVPFRYIAFRSSGLTLNEFNGGSPTVSGHAMTEQSVTVGAIRFNQDDVEDFSSYGGTLSNGTSVGVDFSAPDGVNTNVGSIGINTYGDGTEVDGDIFKNFFGTSAAAPSAAAAVALLQSALPTWYPLGYNQDIIQLYKDNAKGSAKPLQAGAGMIDVNKVFNSLASQTASITAFTILDDADGNTPTASIDTLKINVIGDFFPPAPAVGEPSPIAFYMDGVQLTGTVLTNGSIEATIPPFSGNPDLQVYTPPKEGSVNNGGFSEPFQFFQDGKIALTVTANPPIKNEDGSIIHNPVIVKFGQDYQSKMTYSVAGIPEGGILDENGNALTFEDVFPTVVFETPADNVDYPDVNNYPVTPSFNGEAYDTDKYIVNFINGDLVIEKNDITISTEDVSITYGQAIDAPLVYDYDLADILNDTNFRSYINTSHASDFKDGLPNKFEAIVNKFEAIVNEYDLSFLDGGSWSASESIGNKFEAIVNGMNVLNLDSENFINYINSKAAFDNGTTNKFEAIVNKFEAIVNSEDLFNGDVLLQIENKFEAIVNKFEAIVNEDDPTNPYGGYAKVFTIIDTLDASSPILQVYALNLITGLNVTAASENHLVYPGTFLNSISANFNITYVPGSLTVLPKELTVSTDTLTIPFGQLITKEDLMTSFDGWAFEGEFQESEATVFPEIDGGIPYYFIKEGGDGTELKIEDLEEIGNYQIKIRNPQNYEIIHTVNAIYGTLKIEKTTLNVEIDDLVINQGEVPEFTSEFSGFNNGDSVDTVFPDGISYYVVDEYGIEQSMDEIGVFIIKIRAPENYDVEFEMEGKLYINPYGTHMKKIRNYLDCVVHSPNDPSGFDYVAKFRYENPNDNTLYVLNGVDNNINGDATYSGELPIVFLPGEGTFEIRFDGNLLKWNITTFESTHKTSASASANSDSGKCSGGGTAEGDPSYTVFPNPVQSVLTIQQNDSENSDVAIFNSNGILMYQSKFTKRGSSTKDVNMTAYPNGYYYVKITTKKNEKVYIIIKS